MSCMSLDAGNTTIMPTTYLCDRSGLTCGCSGLFVSIFWAASISACSASTVAVPFIVSQRAVWISPDCSKTSKLQHGPQLGMKSETTSDSPACLRSHKRKHSQATAVGSSLLPDGLLLCSFRLAACHEAPTPWFPSSGLEGHLNITGRRSSAERTSSYLLKLR